GQHDRGGQEGGGAGGRGRSLRLSRRRLSRFCHRPVVRRGGGDRLLRLSRGAKRASRKDGAARPRPRPDLRLVPQALGAARAGPKGALCTRTRVRAVLQPPRGGTPVRAGRGFARPLFADRSRPRLDRGRASGSLMPEPIRVLHVITRLILGGAQENTLLTAIGQHRNPAFRVTLLSGVDDGPEGDLHAEARASGLDLVILPSLVRPIRPATDVRAFWDLYRFMRRGRFDIVHTHSSKAGILG